jgi:hypothetical protein
VRTLSISADYAPRPQDFLNVRQMFHEFRYSETTRLDNGELESRRLFIAPINWQFNSGDRAEFNWVPTFERLFAPFEISPGVILPPGDYRFTRWRLEAFSASKRRLEGGATWWFGTFWSGRADEVELFLRYKLPPRFLISFSTAQTFADLPQGSFCGSCKHFGSGLRLLAVSHVLQLAPVRQRVAELRLAEPRSLDLATGERRVLCFQPRVDSGPRWRLAIPDRGQQAFGEDSVHVSFLTALSPFHRIAHHSVQNHRSGSREWLGDENGVVSGVVWRSRSGRGQPRSDRRSIAKSMG